MIIYVTNKPSGEIMEVQSKMWHGGIYQENVHGVGMLWWMNHDGWVD